MSSAARQTLLDLEGPGTRYQPIFGNTFRQTVSEILTLANRAKVAAEDSVSDVTKEARETKSYPNWLTGLLVGCAKLPQNTSETEDLLKSIQYLSQAINSLSNIFDLQKPECVRNRSKLISGGLASTPETQATEGGRVLTPHGRWQVLQGLAKPDVRYAGDPDLIPISQSEVGWLVRLMHQFCTHVNLKFGPALQSIYTEEGVVGELARMALQPPCSFYTLEKSVDGAPPTRHYGHHNARISLRFLGGKQVLVYSVLVVLFFSLLLRTSIYKTIIILLIIIGSFCCLLAVGRSLISKNKPSESVMSTPDQSKLD